MDDEETREYLKGIIKIRKIGDDGKMHDSPACRQVERAIIDFFADGKNRQILDEMVGED